MANKTFVSNGTFTVADNDAVAFGASVAGTEIVKIQSGVTGVKLDANFEQIVLSGSLSTYKFLVVSGTGLQILATDGTTVIATIPNLNQVVKLVFADGFTTLTQTGSTAFKLGASSAVSTSAAGAPTPPVTLLTGYSVSDFATAVSGIVVSETITVSDTASAISTDLGLGATSVLLTNAAKIDFIDANTAGAGNEITMTYSQFNVLKGKVATDDTIKIVDTAANMNVSALVTEQANIDLIDANTAGAGNEITMTYSQFNVLKAKVDNGDTINIIDTSANVQGGLATLVANVAQIDAVNSSENSVAINMDYASFNALETKLDIGDTIKVVDSISAVSSALNALVDSTKPDAIVTTTVSAGNTLNVLATDGTASGSYTTVNQADASSVNAAGKWYFDDASDTLTIYDATGSAAVDIILTGAATVTVANTGVVTIATLG